MLQNKLKSLFNFTGLIILQVLVFNQINLFGFCYPTLYLIFIITYRFDYSRFNLILISFLMGFLIDLLQSTPGTHTIASLCIGFIRPLIIRVSFNTNLENSYILSSESRIMDKIIYIVLMVFMHQILLQSVTYFSFTHFSRVLRNTLANTIFTSVLILAAISFIKTKK